ncbi:DNA-binding MarR family transcriptional regulator [Rhizobium petrolearium]|uniref:MarR family winged helix-turn-helix transcriptional regulator n=2 Tax=Neorhizobium TaxID=1525371 RepID=A0ABV0MD13_9HYPH|nr:MarR family winged helix-turn-helix transcriptional regulator [Neorhizobium petrolearium]MBP1848424.1 DNA-binding MarR family transcriptional regulator [Neorhizobium petrolearium]MCC2614483.1 MarR family winged helix-turn-helix transcriptional regulator [Neorhizobium petrolearium]WGI72245.1 MarR family winged helix-turn-helix transcriptional regulator [Neorhizobium petrolearium]
MSLEDLYARPAHLIRRAHQISWAIFLDECEEFALTPVQYAALVSIDAVPGTDATRISNMIAFDRSTIGNVLDRLEKRGLIERRPSQTDRRQRLVFLTDQGSRLLADCKEAVDRVQNRIVGVLSRSEREIFLKLMTRIVHLHNDVTSAPIRSLDG